MSELSEHYNYKMIDSESSIPKKKILIRKWAMNAVNTRSAQMGKIVTQYPQDMLETLIKPMPHFRWRNVVRTGIVSIRVDSMVEYSRYFKDILFPDSSHMSQHEFWLEVMPIEYDLPLNINIFLYLYSALSEQQQMLVSQEMNKMAEKFALPERPAAIWKRRIREFSEQPRCHESGKTPFAIVGAQDITKSLSGIKATTPDQDLIPPVLTRGKYRGGEFTTVKVTAANLLALAIAMNLPADYLLLWDYLQNTWQYAKIRTPDGSRVPIAEKNVCAGSAFLKLDIPAQNELIRMASMFFVN